MASTARTPVTSGEVSGGGGSVLVTGSNRGIGLEVVRQLTEATNPPDHIFASCRDPEGPRALVLRQLAEKHPGLVTIVRLDTSDPASISVACQEVGARLADGGLNLLINNAAINISPCSLAQAGKDQMVDCFVTNVVGPMLLAKELLPYLRQAAVQSDSGSGMSCRRAAIINVSTLISSIQKCPETFAVSPLYPYRVSKAALNMLTRCLAEDLKKDGILVTAIHPGWVQTDMGGPQAKLPTVDSARCMLGVMSSLTEKHSGTLLDWEGNGIPW